MHGGNRFSHRVQTPRQPSALKASQLLWTIWIPTTFTFNILLTKRKPNAVCDSGILFPQILSWCIYSIWQKKQYIHTYTSKHWPTSYTKSLSLAIHWKTKKRHNKKQCFVHPSIRRWLLFIITPEGAPVTAVLGFVPLHILMLHPLW